MTGYMFTSLIHTFAQFESDLQKLKIERLRSFNAIENYIEAFEKKRTQDLKVSYISVLSPV